MLKEYKFSNLKAFTQPDAMPIRPITLIYGPNSSGKSTVIQSLLLLKQTLESAIDPDNFLVSRGNLVDLGEYSDFIHKHESHRKLSYELKLDISTKREEKNLFHAALFEFSCIKLEISFQCSERNEVEISYLEVYLQDDKDKMNVVASFCLIAKEGRNALELSQLNSNHLFWKLCWEQYKNIPQIVNRKIAKNLKERQEDYEVDSGSKVKVEAKTKNADFLNRLEKYLDGYSYENFIDDLLKVNKCFVFHLDRLLNLRLTTSISVASEVKDLLEYYELSEDTPNPIVNLLVVSLESLRTLLYDSVYIGPIRQSPKREYILGDDLIHHISPSGEKIFDLFYDDFSLIAEVNRWFEKFSIDYKIDLSVELLVTHEEVIDIGITDESKEVIDIGITDESEEEGSKSAIRTYDEYQPYMPIDEKDLRHQKEKYGNRLKIEIEFLDKIYDTKVSLKDIGFGISQILPIIVQSLASNNKMLLIEQPEVHIHPRLQAELGSLLSECIKSPFKNKFIIETHSESLILRLKSLIKKGKLKNSQAAVIYIERTSKGSQCLNLRLNRSGKFLDDWPDGFFEESFIEMLGTSF